MKPPLKWVGGKGKLLPQLRPLLPKDYTDRMHVEPFAGGAALFFDQMPQQAMLSDTNQDLISFYRTLRDEGVLPILEYLRTHERLHCPEHYYLTRARYNEGLAGAEHAAAFAYLNKTCFNGLYRVNKKGHFNVPVGSYKNPHIVNPEALFGARECLRHASLTWMPYHMLRSFVPDYAFVYLDPPYDGTFNAYTSEDFDQRRLHSVFLQLTEAGVPVMLSNSATPAILELYKGWNVTLIDAPRAINRGPKVQEVIVRNYG